MNAIRAEWTKLHTTPGPAWLLLITATVTVALGVTVTSVSPCCNVDATRLALSGVYLGQVPIAVLAVLTVSGEYSTTLIRTTLTTVPDRRAILPAKALTLTLPVAAAGAFSLLACLLVAHLSLTDGPALRAAAGSVLYLLLIAVLSLGTAATLRDSGTAIGAVLALLYLPPILTPAVANPHLHRLFDQLSPMTAGLAIQSTKNLHELPIAPWPGLAVLTAWSAAAFVTGTLLLQRRDA